MTASIAVPLVREIHVGLRRVGVVNAIGAVQLKLVFFASAAVRDAKFKYIFFNACFFDLEAGDLDRAPVKVGGGLDDVYFLRVCIGRRSSVER